jgi:hypothetical protein
MKACLCALLAGTCLISAQEPAPTDYEARRESVETLKQHIAMRQKRLDEVTAEIRDRAQKTDKKIEDLVTMLAGVKDSQDSKRRVSQTKVEAVAGLKRLIQTYRTERRSILERIKSDPDAATDALTADVATADKLIEKRIADIVELIKSMPGGEDVAKYETDSTSSYDGGNIVYENSRISEAWRQNRRDKVESQKERREAQAALEKSIADLGRRRDSLSKSLSAGDISGAEKEIQEQELAYVKSALDQRTAQLAEVTAPAEAPAETASKGEADDMKRMLGDARSDIAADVAKNLRLYCDAVDERDKIHGLQENLAAREKWLQENDPSAKKGE